MLIKLKNVKKFYDENKAKVTALNGIDLEIDRGEYIAIMGASGSGKSTLLNIIGCLDKMSEGDYFLEDKEVNSFTDTEMAKIRNEKFGFVVQDFALIEKYTVKKNIVLPLLYSKKYKRDKNTRVLEMVKMVGLETKLNTLVSKLSGGQRQRVAIARALVNDAEVLLCDEPTGALDKKTGSEILDSFDKCNKRGKTVIIVTHDDKVARRCKRIIELEDGRIINDRLNDCQS